MPSSSTESSDAGVALAPSTRLPLRPPPYPPEVAARIHNNAFGALSPQNLRLVLAHQPALAAAFQAMAQQILFKGALPERQREIAIIRTGALTRSEYEWGMHVSLYAARCGLGDEQVADLTLAAPGAASSSLWTEAERCIVRMVDELHQHSTVADATWAEMRRHWPEDQIVELILSSSFYHMAAFFLNSTAVPLEEGAMRFPPGVTQARVPSDPAPCP